MTFKKTVPLVLWRVFENNVGDFKDQKDDGTPNTNEIF